MASLEGSETGANLRAAFAADAQAVLRYRWFAEQADVDGQPELGSVLRSVADAEIGHATGHLDLLIDAGDPVTNSPIGESIDNVRAAIAAEEDEAAAMYPRFAQTARDEGFTEIAEWMESLADASQRQAARLRAALDELA
ncbi:MAG: rubrerythrin family protein [Actinomycetota bacterium]